MQTNTDDVDLRLNELENKATTLQSAVSDGSTNRASQKAEAAHSEAELLVETTEVVFEEAVEQTDSASVFPDTLAEEDRYQKASSYEDELPKEVLEAAELHRLAVAAENDLFYATRVIPDPDADDFDATATNVERYADSMWDVLDSE